jgi:hypothetical protein
MKSSSMSMKKVTPTSCGRIKRTNGALRDWTGLCQQLDELRASMSVDGAAPVRAKIKEIIPEFTFHVEKIRSQALKSPGTMIIRVTIPLKGQFASGQSCSSRGH